ncbi:MAG: chromosomal replication initiator protein DnaA [Desulfobacterales bacterium]|nr:chromosomal replication initiator protein DnaA [Desulfobacterales bacterium]
MENIWKEAKNSIAQNIPNNTFEMWIEPLEFVAIQGEDFVISCPNVFFKKRIMGNYSEMITSELSRISGKNYKLFLDVSPTDSKKNEEVGKQLQLPNMIIKPCGGRMLRKDFTFDQFVVSGNNRFAYSAALAFASQKNTGQNSLYLLAKTGMGKSHLSQAIGHHILTENAKERVYYITAEDFTNEMVNAFKNSSVDNFKDRYRKNCDVLMIEDVQFLSGKERTQTELAFTLDSLFDSDKKIIFTSSSLPNEIPKINDALRSRLSFGIISNIEPPDFRTRVRILEKKAKANNFIMAEEVLQYLASELTENVRQLESGLIGIAAKASLLGMPADMQLAESVVQHIAQKRKSITIDLIKDMISKYYKISVAELSANTRKQNIARPRQIAMYLSRRYTDQPLQVIGKSFNRYHATALHAINMVEKWIKEKSPMQKQVEYFCEKLDSGKF